MERSRRISGSFLHHDNRAMRVSEFRIDIDRLKIYSYHGVLPAERQIGNEFEVSATLFYDASAAAGTDDIGRALNYAEAVNVIEEEMAVPSSLLEHVAHRIATALLDRFPALTGGTVTVAKIHPPIPSQLGSVRFSMSFVR